MFRDLYCPICGALQKQLNLDETENVFVCDKCETTIKVMELPKDKKKFGYRIIAERKTEKIEILNCT